MCIYTREGISIYIYIDTYIYTKPTTGPTPLTERPLPSAQARHATLKALKLEVLEKTAAAELGAHLNREKIDKNGWRPSISRPKNYERSLNVGKCSTSSIGTSKCDKG